MGCSEVAKDMIYDPERDIWSNSTGKVFIKNEFVPGNPEWIDISTPIWSVSYHGKYLAIDWNIIEHKPRFLEALQIIAKEKLKSNSLAYIAAIKQLVVNVTPMLSKPWQDFGDISISDFLYIWDNLTSNCRTFLREFYSQMVDMEIGGAKSDIAYELAQWKARNDLQILRDVLTWHETRGALTSSEEKVLRELLSTNGGMNESDKEHAARIFGWLLLDTLKRPTQVLGIRKNGLREVTSSDGKSEWFVEIQPIKHQAGMPLRWWRISEELAKEIISFSERKWVAELQERFDRMIVWDVPCLVEHGVVGGGDAKSALSLLIAKRKPISPRTKKRLHVTPTRIRHTGATRLAFQGVSRDLIQEILEHDSPESAQFYIDSVGSEIVPAIEKAGRMMGNIFHELNTGFFQGRIVNDISNQPVVKVPEASTTPLIVGACSRDTTKDGACPRHPFLSCYDGCSCFFAWDSPDPHGKALAYFEKEIEKWATSVEAAKQKHVPHFIAEKTLETYQRAASAAKEVLGQIQRDER